MGIRYPRGCDPNKNDFDLLLYLEWRAEKYPRLPVAEKAPIEKETHLRVFPFAGLAFVKVNGRIKGKFGKVEKLALDGAVLG